MAIHTRRIVESYVNATLLGDLASCLASLLGDGERSLFIVSFAYQHKNYKWPCIHKLPQIATE